jgi:hypothetical protein
LVEIRNQHDDLNLLVNQTPANQLSLPSLAVQASQSPASGRLAMRRCVFITTFGVLPAQRGKGYSRRLLT